MAQRGADTVRAGVAATDHNDVLASGIDETAVLKSAVQQAAGIFGEELHGEMNPGQFPSGNGQIPGTGRPGSEQQRIVFRLQFGGVHIDAYIRAHAEMNAALRHHLHAAIHQRLVELHVGNAVHQQSPDPVFALEDRHLVPRLVELIRRRQTRGAGADHRHGPARAPLRRIVPYPPLGKAPVDDGVLDGS